MDFCNCGDGLGNTGTPNCQELMDVTRKIVLVQTYADDGTRNRIPKAGDFGEAEITALLNHEDPSKRWYPTTLLDNVEDVKGDNTYETLNSGKNLFIKEGIRTFKAVSVGQSATYVGKQNQAKCVEFGIYIIDKSRKLTGEVSSDGDYLDLIPVDNETFAVTLEKATDTTVQKAMISFEFSEQADDSKLKSITADELGFNVLNIEGLKDLNGVASLPLVESVTVTLTLDYGTFKNAFTATGFEEADFSAYNNTTSAAVVLTSVTEGDNGVYAIVTPTQTLADDIDITVSKDGYEDVVINYVVA